MTEILANKGPAQLAQSVNPYDGLSCLSYPLSDIQPPREAP
jgi:hypothetical protein